MGWQQRFFFDLIDMRKVRPRNYVTGRWVLTIKTGKRGNFHQGQGLVGTEKFPRQTKILFTN